MILSNLHPEIQEILQRIAANLPSNQPAYLVGGVLRDLLIGHPTKDLDFVLQGGAILAGRRIADLLKADFYPLDPQRDTGRVLLHLPTSGRLIIDFAAMRGPDLERDLRSRDFTINALALDLHEPETLIDPLGGANNLFSRELHCCSTSSITSDPIRILRAVRLAVEFNLRISPETTQLIKAGLLGLESVSAERLRDELFRILAGSASWNAIKLLDILGGLRYVLPELEDLKGNKQAYPHVYDVWDHSLSTLHKIQDLEQLLRLEHEPKESTNWTMGLVSVSLGRYRAQIQNHLDFALNPERTLFSLLSFAALYHDTGKPTTISQDDEGHLHHLGHEEESAKLVRRRAEALRLSHAEIDRLVTVIRHHMRPLWLSNTDEPISRRAIYRYFRDTGSAGVDIGLLSLADALATYGPGIPQETWLKRVAAVRILLEAWWERNNETISPPALLNGDDLISHFKLSPGPTIGNILAILREAQAAGEISQQQEALDLAGKIISQG